MRVSTSSRGVSRLEFSESGDEVRQRRLLGFRDDGSKSCSEAERVCFDLKRKREEREC